MLVDKLKEVLAAVLPISVIVLLLNFTIVPLETPVLLRFILGALSVVLGLSIFLFGVDIGITPIGKLMGSYLGKSNKLLVIIAGGLTLGFFISIAEPDLHILAGQVATVTGGVINKLSIVLVVSVGVAVMIAVGLLRIVGSIKLRKVLLVVYAIIFGLSLFSSPEFLAIAFDASGATTGAMTVPFVLAVALGTSALKKDSKSSEEDSFGLVALASSGAIMAVLIMSVFSKTGELTGSLNGHGSQTNSILAPFWENLRLVGGEVFAALIPILILFVIFQKTAFKLSQKSYWRILKGLIYTYIGLVLFLTGVNAGFMEVGSIVGHDVAMTGNWQLLVGIGFVLGLVTILAEPAVHVLTRQIEDVTSGYVKRKSVLFALSIGVGVSVALSVVRIVVPGIQLWHLLLPGYAISLIMMHFVPSLFVGIAFDSGGVASGPMAATFILAFTQGVAEAVEGANVLTDGFGVIALVALTPLIALQILGIVFQIKSKKKGLKSNETHG